MGLETGCVTLPEACKLTSCFQCVLPIQYEPRSERPRREGREKRERLILKKGKGKAIKLGMEGETKHEWGWFVDFDAAEVELGPPALPKKKEQSTSVLFRTQSRGCPKCCGEG